MVPEIQLMLRIERQAELQRRHRQEARGDATAFELIHPLAPLQRVRRAVNRLTEDDCSLKLQMQGVQSCNCAH